MAFGFIKEIVKGATKGSKPIGDLVADVTNAPIDRSDPNAEKPPPPDGWPGWQYQASTGSWTIPRGQENSYAEWQQAQQIQAAADAAASNAPTMDDAAAAGFGTENIADANIAQQDGQSLYGRPIPTVDQAQIADARATRDAALTDQRRVLEKALNLGVDPVEQQALQQRFFERATGAANTLAANARGGAGAVAAARQQANQLMPQIAGQAAEQGRAAELQAFQSRVAAAQTAGGIANTIGQTATSAFGQEAGLATDTARVGLEAIDRINAQTGMQIQADLGQQQQLGTMLSDIFQLGYNYAALDVGTQTKVFEEIAASHQIDQQIAGQIKAAAEANKKGVMDYVMGFLGAGEKAAGAASGLGWKPLS